ncbi:sensor histidine kinase [Streptomyces sp. 110]|uniref:histidine kinase n=1 Tax=Streptomyces endocoffeicus TaxID=2898945 RepID=A0ABS1Q1P9_9ACTN|nr:histidine kinase [Streptomyces endocoffeicus]MBL1118087.1 sensor histidine kinase [Streptomyces endocoffeicus]
MISQDLKIMVANALTGVRALGLLLNWPVWAMRHHRRRPAVGPLVERQSQVDTMVLGPLETERTTPAREVLWLVFQAVLGPAVLGLSMVMWAIALFSVSTPLWWRLGPPAVVFVPVRDTTSSVIAALYGLILLLLAAACSHGLPRWHARVGRTLLEGPHRSRLTRRIATLTASRTGVLEVQAAELRRIERDLHDGAQARLVSTGMLLGLLDMRLRELPDDRKLLREARAEIGAALRELRDVVRGVYPPILADRGLAGGIESLAERAGAALTGVAVTVDVPGRLPVALESTVYFVVAEALTNVTKHSGANRAEITVRSDRERVRVEVLDDGRGGADELRGTGIAGLRRRVAAFDGSLSLVSPVGGPTTLRAELPCVS